MIRPLVDQCKMCNAALLSGEVCASCGFDNKDVGLAPVVHPKLARNEFNARMRSLKAIQESRGRPNLPPDRSPVTPLDDEDDES